MESTGLEFRTKNIDPASPKLAEASGDDHVQTADLESLAKLLTDKAPTIDGYLLRSSSSIKDNLQISKSFYPTQKRENCPIIKFCSFQRKRLEVCSLLILSPES